ncbi:MAG: Ni/Fe-hydrogenase, b-type cytochrome subunit [Flavobacteriaceae bacterium]|nr:Ni/Fe-hydrogenase, b-type cytochrome subunit [Flavobacteriaceae bacterium]
MQTIIQTNDFKRVLVWELPVRIFHWLNALSITVLAITGFIIANPPAIMSSAEAIDSYWFGTVRAIHFITAYVFLANAIVRVYWAFKGNYYSNWRAFIPYSKSARKNILHVMKVDILLQNEEKEVLKNISVGHNYVASFSYLILFLLALVQIFTGFGLYAPTSGWWLPKLFAWVPDLFGGDAQTRFVHHISTWLFIIFTMIHVYLVFYHDWLEGRGESSSMISGYKFVRKERIEGDDHI